MLDNAVPSIGQLRIICIPEHKLKRWFRVLVVRRISIFITKLLLYTPVTANQVTLTMFFSGLLAGVLFIFNNYWASLAGAVILIFGLFLDAVDGEIARYRQTASLRGEFLDRVNHILVSPFMFVGISFGAYAQTNYVPIFFFGFSASLFTLLKRLCFLERFMILNKAGRTEREKAILFTLGETTDRSSTRIKKLFKKLAGKIPDIPYDDDLTVVAILVGAIFGALPLILVIYGLMLPSRWLLQTVFDYKYHL